MRLTDTDIGEFQMLWEQETGQKLTDSQAQEHAQRLLGFVELVLEPSITKKEEPP